jgi:phosphoadenosine phosphosulfate reductase
VILTAKIRAAVQLLRRIEREFAPAAFANSLGAEDMVLTDLIARHAPGIEIFCLDTGRLPRETHRLWQRAGDHFRVTIRPVHPLPHRVDEFIERYGVDGFYRGIEARRACCHARKVEPLARALAGKRAWVTGLRRDQAASRRSVEVAAWDADNRLHKFNPLADWRLADVWKYLRMHDVPYNELHDRGYPSVGCAPCTRAISAGEDLRAGRWWWENPEGKECGLHRRPVQGAAPADAATE